MPYRRLLSSLALFAFAAPAIAQQSAPLSSPAVPAVATRLVGQIATSVAPTADAVVELLRAQAVVRSVRTRADGRFEFDHLPTGDYRVRVSREGMNPQEQMVRLAGPADTIRFQVRDRSTADATQSSESFSSSDSVRRVSARGQGRHWDCRVTDHEVHNAAILAYNRFLGADAPSLADSARAFGLPYTRDGFLNEFRRVSDPTECRRIASAIDKQYGLTDQNLRVFRVGKIYFFPDFGDGGMVVGLDGKVLAIYISQG
jgi:hypothetical protein